MKRSIFVISSLFAALAAGNLQAQDLKVGLIDFAYIQAQYWRTSTERDRFEAQRAEKTKQIDERRAKIKELIQLQQDAQAQLQDPTLSDDKKKETLGQAQERSGQITSLQRETIEMEGAVQKDLAAEASAIQKSITKEIYDEIGNVSKGKGLDFVLNRTFGINGVPTTAYASTERLEDFSEEVIEKLNANAPEGWEPPAKEDDGEGEDKSDAGDAGDGE